MWTFLFRRHAPQHAGRLHWGSHHHNTYLALAVKDSHTCTQTPSTTSDTAVCRQQAIFQHACSKRQAIGTSGWQAAALTRHVTVHWGSAAGRLVHVAGSLLPWTLGQASFQACYLKGPSNCCAGSLYHGKLADHEIETELEAGTDAMPLPSTSPESNGPQKYEGAYKGPSKRNSFTSHCATEAGAQMQYRGRLSSY